MSKPSPEASKTRGRECVWAQGQDERTDPNPSRVKLWLRRAFVFKFQTCAESSRCRSVAQVQRCPASKPSKGMISTLCSPTWLYVLDPEKRHHAASVVWQQFFGSHLSSSKQTCGSSLSSMAFVWFDCTTLFDLGYPNLAPFMGILLINQYSNCKVQFDEVVPFCLDQVFSFPDQVQSIEELEVRLRGWQKTQCWYVLIVDCDLFWMDCFTAMLFCLHLRLTPVFISVCFDHPVAIDGYCKMAISSYIYSYISSCRSFNLNNTKWNLALSLVILVRFSSKSL